jgi:hypothetical protein
MRAQWPPRRDGPQRASKKLQRGCPVYQEIQSPTEATCLLGDYREFYAGLVAFGWRPTSAYEEEQDTVSWTTECQNRFAVHAYPDSALTGSLSAKSTLADTDAHGRQTAGDLGQRTRGRCHVRMLFGNRIVGRPDMTSLSELPPIFAGGKNWPRFLIVCWLFNGAGIGEMRPIIDGPEVAGLPTLYFAAGKIWVAFARTIFGAARSREGGLPSNRKIDPTADMTRT